MTTVTISTFFEKAKKAATAVFRWHPSILVPSLWTSVFGMITLGLSQNVFSHAFDLAYLFAACAFVWSWGGWLTSNTLRKKRPKRRAKANTIKRYRRLKWAVSALILAVSVCTAIAIHASEVAFELSQPGGKLFPANDRRPNIWCNSQMPTDALAVYMGNSAVWFTGQRAFSFFAPDALPIITTTGNEVILGIIKDDKGAISLSARIKDRDLKLLAEIEDNTFRVNEHNVFSMKRTDRSTLVVRDDYGNTVLNVHYLNPTTVTITGKLYYAPDSYVLLGDKEMTQVSHGNKFTMENCFSGSGMFVE